MVRTQDTVEGSQHLARAHFSERLAFIPSSFFPRHHLTCCIDNCLVSPHSDRLEVGSRDTPASELHEVGIVTTNGQKGVAPQAILPIQTYNHHQKLTCGGSCTALRGEVGRVRGRRRSEVNFSHPHRARIATPHPSHHPINPPPHKRWMRLLPIVVRLPVTRSHTKNGWRGGTVLCRVLPPL